MCIARRHVNAAVAGVAATMCAMLSLVACPTVAIADPVSITTATYGSPQITSDNSGTLITVDSPPGGLYYNISLDPTQSYRVTVLGSPVGNGSFTLRLMQDQDAPAWQPAPSGIEVYRVSSASTFQLLFYRSTAADATSYRVDSIQVDACGTSCGTDSDLRAQILQDSTGLASALAGGNTDLAAELIQHWAAPRTPAASVQSEIPPEFGTRASELYYDYFQTQRGGVFCEGAAQFLHELLALFSIPSFVVSFGDVSFFTHAVVVVPMQNTDGTTDYRLLDPTFDATYSVGPYGAPVTIPQMLELWRAGMSDLIEPSFGAIAARTVISEPYSDGHFQTQPCSQDASWETMCSFSTFTSAWAPYFEAYGYEPGLPGLLKMLGTRPLLEVSTLNVPSDFIQMQSTFSSAVAAGDQSVHIAALPLPPTLSQAPETPVAPVVGQPLTVSEGAWTSPAAPVNQVSYEWELCNGDASVCTPLPGVNGDSYTPTASTIGDRLRVSVTARNEYGDSQPAVVLTAPVNASGAPTKPALPAVQPSGSPAPAPNLSRPHIRGVASVGHQLVCVAPAGSSVHSYAWFRSGRVISGAHAARYRVRRADSGRFLKCGLVAPSGRRSRASATVLVPFVDAVRRGKSRPRSTGGAARAARSASSRE